MTSARTLRQPGAQLVQHPWMDRAQLQGWLEEGLSLAQIAERTGRHPSTVGYWCKKLGLVPNGRTMHAPRGGLSQAELRVLVERGWTLRAIAGHFAVSVATVRYWITRYGLPPPITFRRTDIANAIAAGDRTLRRTCPEHGRTMFVVENSGRSRCRKCRIERVAAHRRRVKALLVAEAGGRCCICGYNRCLAALQFHHVDPSAKSFALSLRGITRSMGALRAEAMKCALLCANCHAEVEAGFTRLECGST